MGFFKKPSTPVEAPETEAKDSYLVVRLDTEVDWNYETEKNEMLSVTVAVSSHTFADGSIDRTFKIEMPSSLPEEFVAMAEDRVEVPLLVSLAARGIEMLVDADEVTGELHTQLQELAVGELFPLISSCWGQQTAANAARGAAAAAAAEAARKAKEDALKAKYNLR